MINEQCGKEIKWEPKTFADIWLAIALCPIEVSGLAKVRKEGTVYTVYDDVIIPEQICSASNTEFDDVEYDKWCRELIETGLGESLNEYRLWWHSHITGEVSPSPTDKENISRWSHCDWWLSFIGNKFGDWLVRIDIFQPERLKPCYNPSQSFTERIGKSSFRALMHEREKRINELINRRVHEDSRSIKRSCERILLGIFNDE